MESAHMQFLLALLLLPGVRICAQTEFADSSRLRDTSYVQRQIREISDSDLWNAFDLHRPGLESLQALVRARKFSQAARAWERYWDSKKQPRYLTRMDHLLLDTDMLSDLQLFRTSMEESTEERDTILARADSILHNTIRAWGDVVVHFGDHVNFNQPVGQTGIYGFHYWLWSRPLLMAAVITGRQEYVRKFDALFNRWFEQRNEIDRPIPKFDVVYYELGLGVRNRMFIEYYLLHETRRSSRTHVRLLKTFLAAGRWLYELERWEGYRPGNWQIHGSYMLTQLALTFPEFREAPSWLATGLRRMVEHLERDFFPDGGHSERCPRNYTLATYLAFRNLAYLLSAYGSRKDVAEEIQASMGRTVDWWLAMIAPTGEIPAINDSHRGLFPTLVLKDGERLFGKSDVSGVLHNLFGEKTSRIVSFPPFVSRHMPASGFTVMRTDWTPEALYFSLNYGPYSGFHTHNDCLDFELYAYGVPLAVDAGIGLTYDDPLYVPWYQSSRAHNMVVVNDSNMERDGVQGERVRWDSLSLVEYFSGEQNGYRRFGVRQRREVAFVKPSYWFVLDNLTCDRTGDTLSWYLHSPAGLRPDGDGFVSESSPGLRILPAGGHFKTRSGWGWAASTHDRRPGRTERIRWICFDQASIADSTLQFPILLAPFRAPDTSCSVARLTGCHYIVRRADTTDDLYFSGRTPLEGPFQTDAVFLCVRSVKQTPQRFALVEGTYLLCRGRRIWQSDRQGSAEGNVPP